MNIAILMGRLTVDPELKQTPNGISVCQLSIAVDRKIKSKDGEKQTDFINIVAWRGTADFIAKYFKKGNKIGITGSIQTRQYTDKQGNKRTVFEVVADNVEFVESKNSNNSNSNENTGNSEKANANTPMNNDFENIDDDDLPF